MVGIDPSELRPLTQLFDVATHLYEGVMKRREGHTDLDRSSYDATDISDLNTALSTLSIVRETLESKPDRENWLLHLAGVEWQQGQVLFALGRLDDAAAANERLRLLIPQVAQYMWMPNQEQEYRSNYHFLAGKVAVEKGTPDVAIMEFQNSLRIDQAIGDVGGQRDCAQRLELLGLATQRGPIVRGRRRPKRMGLGPAAVVFMIGYLAGFYLAVWWALVLLGVELSASWAVIGDSAWKMQAVLVSAPALATLLGVVVSMASSAALLVMRTVRPTWEAIWNMGLNVIFSTMVVTGVLVLTVIGRTTAEMWIANIGRSFYPVYFIFAPVVGLVGGLVWLTAVSTLRNH